MRIRRIAVAAAMAVTVVVPVVSTGVPALAKAPAVARHGDDDRKKGKKKVVFAAAGTITAVDGTSLTVAVKGGTKDVRGRTVTFVVADGARVRLNGKRVKVSALAAGFKVGVAGTRAGDVYSVTNVEANGRTPKPKPTPSSSASPVPTSSPSASPVPTSSPSASPVPTSSPSVSSSVSPSVSPSSTPTD